MMSNQNQLYGVQDCTPLYTKKYFQDRDCLDYHLAESIKILMQENGLKKVLDVGCGTGRLTKFLNRNGFQAFGCDQAQEAVKQAQKINPKKKIIRASAAKLPFKSGSFDLVTAISLIEHLNKKESQKFLKEVWRILRPNGFVFLITPNFQSPLKYLLGKKWFAYSDPTHVQFFTPQSLAKLLKIQGFRQIKFRLKTAYKLPTDFHLPQFCRSLPRPIKNFLNYLMVSSPLSTFRDSFWVLARKPIEISTILHSGSYPSTSEEVDYATTSQVFLGRIENESRTKNEDRYCR